MWGWNSYQWGYPYRNFYYPSYGGYGYGYPFYGGYGYPFYGGYGWGKHRRGWYW